MSLLVGLKDRDDFQGMTEHFLEDFFVSIISCVLSVSAVST